MSADKATQDAARSNDENTPRIYQALDTQMMTLHRRTDEKSRAESEETARILLGNADLPLVLRCRALMVLGCSNNEPDYIAYAEEGVRIAQLAISVATVVGEIERDLLISAEKVLSQAREAFEAEQEEGEDKEQPADATEGESKIVLPNGIVISWGDAADEEDDDAEVVWEAASDDETAGAKVDDGLSGAVAEGGVKGHEED